MPNSYEWQNSITNKQLQRELQENPVAWNGICAGSEIESSRVHAEGCPFKIFHEGNGTPNLRSAICFEAHLKAVRKSRKSHKKRKSE